MFTYVNMKNFKSFSDTCFNLQKRKDTPKKIAVIYGANGSGKTTLVHVFALLKKTLVTMRSRDMLKDIFENKIPIPKGIPLKSEVILEVIKDRLSNNEMESIIEEYKLKNSKENMVLEYGFVLDGSTGKYYIEMDDTSIVRERLEYKINKKRGCLFDIEKNSIMINNNVFLTEEFSLNIKKQIEMYWGKHTLLSILFFEMEDKTKEYIEKNVWENIIKIINYFKQINYKIKNDHSGERMSLCVDTPILCDFESGIIKKKDVALLNKLEKVLDEIIRTLYTNVEKAYYKRVEHDNGIEYELMLTKRIKDNVFDISFAAESTGTHELFDLLPYLVKAIDSKFVIIDEFGNGIHDLLTVKLIESVNKLIKGQLIITTHNTLLMDQIVIKPEALYFIMVDGFNKSIKCVTDIEERLHPKYNYRNRYLTNDLYKNALPKLNKLNLDELVELYKEK